jgi:hypothetical protein
MKTIFTASALVISLSSSAFAFSPSSSLNAKAVPANTLASAQIIEVGMGVKNRSSHFRSRQFSQTQGYTTQRSGCLLCTGLGLGVGNLVGLNLNLGVAQGSRTTSYYSHRQGSRISHR